MGVQIDLIIPPVIVGLLIILIFNVNSFILETSVDNRLANDMQTFADVSVDIVQEEMRGLVSVNTSESILLTVLDEDNEPVPVSNNYTKFVYTVQQGTKQDEVTIWAENGVLKIKREGDITPSEETAVYPAYIKDFVIEYDPNPTLPPFLRVKVTTESRPEHHARVSSKKNDDTVVRAFAEKQIYLRNIDLQ